MGKHATQHVARHSAKTMQSNAKMKKKIRSRLHKSWTSPLSYPLRPRPFCTNVNPSSSTMGATGAGGGAGATACADGPAPGPAVSMSSSMSSSPSLLLSPPLSSPINVPSWSTCQAGQSVSACTVSSLQGNMCCLPHMSHMSYVWTRYRLALNISHRLHIACQGVAALWSH